MYSNVCKFDHEVACGGGLAIYHVFAEIGSVRFTSDQFYLLLVFELIAMKGFAAVNGSVIYSLIMSTVSHCLFHHPHLFVRDGGYQL